MRGGTRPGGGRPRGSKDKQPRKKARPPASDAEKIRQMLAMGTKAKARFYQEFMQRVGRGEKLTVSEMKMMDKLGLEIAEVAGLPTKPPEPGDATATDLEADEYLRRVWNDPNIDHALRIRAAEIAFKGPGEKLGKKDQKNERAKSAGAGKFASMSNRLRVVGAEK